MTRVVKGRLAWNESADRDARTTRRTLLTALMGAAGALVATRLRAQPQRPDREPVRPSLTGEAAGKERSIGGVTFCWCPPGHFVMGSAPGETGHRPDEAQVDVRITRGFWMAKFETTQAVWTRIVGAFPDKAPAAETGLGDDLPVYWVNFAEAGAFCSALERRARADATLPASWVVRLPTEAQWEYACRAGTTTATAFGDRLGRDAANFSGETLNGGAEGAIIGRGTPVGRYPPNPWGLCDMHGNIFEWCRDWYHARLPGGSDPDLSGVRGLPNRDGTYSRVRRGGAWNDPGTFCRSALRLRYEPERRSDHIGFRVIVEHA